MKVAPSCIRIDEDVAEYEITIRNHDPSDICLFRIRRSEEKVLSFRPKKGFVLPGESKSITLTILQHKFSRSKLLFKLVKIPFSHPDEIPQIVKEMSGNYDAVWQRGVDGHEGERKKIVDILGSLYQSSNNFSAPPMLQHQPLATSASFTIRSNPTSPLRRKTSSLDLSTNNADDQSASFFGAADEEDLVSLWSHASDASSILPPPSQHQHQQLLHQQQRHQLQQQLQQQNAQKFQRSVISPLKQMLRYDDSDAAQTRHSPSQQRPRPSTSMSKYPDVYAGHSSEKNLLNLPSPTKSPSSSSSRAQSPTRYPPTPVMSSSGPGSAPSLSKKPSLSDLLALPLPAGTLPPTTSTTTMMEKEKETGRMEVSMQAAVNANTLQTALLLADAITRIQSGGAQLGSQSTSLTEGAGASLSQILASHAHSSTSMTHETTNGRKPPYPQHFSADDLYDGFDDSGSNHADRSNRHNNHHNNANNNNNRTIHEDNGGGDSTSPKRAKKNKTTKKKKSGAYNVDETAQLTMLSQLHGDDDDDEHQHKPPKQSSNSTANDEETAGQALVDACLERCCFLTLVPSSHAAASSFAPRSSHGVCKYVLEIVGEAATTSSAASATTTVREGEEHKDDEDDAAENGDNDDDDEKIRQQYEANASMLQSHLRQLGRPSDDATLTADLVARMCETQLKRLFLSSSSSISNNNTNNSNNNVLESSSQARKRSGTQGVVADDHEDDNIEEDDEEEGATVENRVVSLEIRHASLDSLKSSVLRIFHPLAPSSSTSLVERTFLRQWFGPSVRSLTLQHCRLMSLAGMSQLRQQAHFPSLTHLDLSHNELAPSFAAAPLQLPHLRVLNLAHNRLSSLDGLQQVSPQLVSLNVSFNRFPASVAALLKNMAIVGGSGVARTLRHWNMAGNPVSTHRDTLSAYVDTVLQTLPRLTQMDGLDLRQLEKVAYATSTTHHHNKTQPHMSSQSSTVLSQLLRYGHGGPPPLPCQLHQQHHHQQQQSITWNNSGSGRRSSGNNSNSSISISSKAGHRSEVAALYAHFVQKVKRTLQSRAFQLAKQRLVHEDPTSTATTTATTASSSPPGKKSTRPQTGRLHSAASRSSSSGVFHEMMGGLDNGSVMDEDGEDDDVLRRGSNAPTVRHNRRYEDTSVFETKAAEGNDGADEAELEFDVSDSDGYLDSFSHSRQADGRRSFGAVDTDDVDRELELQELDREEARLQRELKRLQDRKQQQSTKRSQHSLLSQPPHPRGKSHPHHPPPTPSSMSSAPPKTSVELTNPGYYTNHVVDASASRLNRSNNNNNSSSSSNTNSNSNYLASHSIFQNQSAPVTSQHDINNNNNNNRKNSYSNATGSSIKTNKSAAAALFPAAAPFSPVSSPDSRFNNNGNNNNNNSVEYPPTRRFSASSNQANNTTTTSTPGAMSDPFHHTYPTTIHSNSNTNTKQQQRDRQAATYERLYTTPTSATLFRRQAQFGDVDPSLLPQTLDFSLAQTAATATSDLRQPLKHRMVAKRDVETQFMATWLKLIPNNTMTASDDNNNNDGGLSSPDQLQQQLGTSAGYFDELVDIAQQNVRDGYGLFAPGYSTKFTPQTLQKSQNAHEILGEYAQAGLVRGAIPRFHGTMLLDQKTFEEMQQDEKYSIWNPRYRVPKPHFGFSKPFKDRPNGVMTAPSSPAVTPQRIKRSSSASQLSQLLGFDDTDAENRGRSCSGSGKKKPPLYDQTVQRLRDGFEKLPIRGTFTRASKGLPSSWYPMDVEEVESIKRRGFFHETIGDVLLDEVYHIDNAHDTTAHSNHLIHPHLGGNHPHQQPHQQQQQQQQQISMDQSLGDRSKLHISSDTLSNAQHIHNNNNNNNSNHQSQSQQQQMQLGSGTNNQSMQSLWGDSDAVSQVSQISGAPGSMASTTNNNSNKPRKILTRRGSTILPPTSPRPPLTPTPSIVVDPDSGMSVVSVGSTMSALSPARRVSLGQHVSRRQSSINLGVAAAAVASGGSGSGGSVVGNGSGGSVAGMMMSPSSRRNSSSNFSFSGSMMLPPSSTSPAPAPSSGLAYQSSASNHSGMMRIHSSVLSSSASVTAQHNIQFLNAQLSNHGNNNHGNTNGNTRGGSFVVPPYPSQCPSPSNYPGSGSSSVTSFASSLTHSLPPPHGSEAHHPLPSSTTLSSSSSTGTGSGSGSAAATLRKSLSDRKNSLRRSFMSSVSAQDLMRQSQSPGGASSHTLVGNHQHNNNNNNIYNSNSNVGSNNIIGRRTSFLASPSPMSMTPASQPHLPLNTSDVDAAVQEAVGREVVLVEETGSDSDDDDDDDNDENGNGNEEVQANTWRNSGIYFNASDDVVQHPPPLHHQHPQHQPVHQSSSAGGNSHSTNINGGIGGGVGISELRKSALSSLFDDSSTYSSYENSHHPHHSHHQAASKKHNDGNGDNDVVDSGNGKDNGEDDRVTAEAKEEGNSAELTSYLSWLQSQNSHTNTTAASNQNILAGLSLETIAASPI